ncbi:MAG: Holliday junction resolvase RuvX [Acholeplasmatales bacterium]|nr:MAG: Holliday junction resolvase RuvX [Acholeplasmatales bacterium]
MKKMGLDLGNRTLGIAISDAEGRLARGLETVRFEMGDHEKPLGRLSEILATHDVDVMVLGLPKNMDNSLGEQAEKVLHFKTLLVERFAQQVVLQDERLSTRFAEQLMRLGNKQRKKRKQTIDQEAAAVILQSYLDANKQEV